MRTSELMRLLEKYTPRTPADLDIRGRELRSARLIPSGPRGRHAPHLDAAAVANVLVAVAASSNASQCVTAATEFLNLELIGSPAEGFGSQIRLNDALVAALSESNLAAKVDEIRLIHPMGEHHKLSTIGGYAALIRWRAPRERRKLSLYLRPAPQAPNRLDRASQIFEDVQKLSMREFTSIGGYLFALIADRMCPGAVPIELDSPLAARLGLHLVMADVQR